MICLSDLRRPFSIVHRLAVAAIVASILTAATTIPLRAQSNATGHIFGQLKPAAPGSRLVAVHRETGLTRMEEPGVRGAFRFSALPVGTYRVAVTSADGRELDVAEQVEVTVGSGSLVRFLASAPTSAEDPVALDALVVDATVFNAVDVSQSESAITFRSDTIRRLPVARDLTSVALLAPGTVSGDKEFGQLASFGGASVAENAYYVNGFNVTNLRTGLGFSTPPFEFFQEFQVKTGGYGAEFGRSTGGVVNAVTHSGSNRWHGGLSAYYEPDGLRASAPSVIVDGDHTLDNRQDSLETLNFNLSARGPLIKDRLFFAGIYNGRNVRDQAANTFSQTWGDEKSSPHFWGGKLDWLPHHDHVIELTAFSDRRDATQSVHAYDQYTATIGAPQGMRERERGGTTSILRYTGRLNDQLTVSALLGRGTSVEINTVGGDPRPYLSDERNVTAPVQLGNLAPLTDSYRDTREAARLDVEYRLAGHRLRAGVDTETNQTRFDVASTGPDNTSYQYISGPGGSSYAIVQQYLNRGRVTAATTAFYLEDSFRVLNDRLLLSAGLRYEDFSNQNIDDATFFAIDRQLAPRLAGVYDLNGDGTAKLFANWGRYFLPIATTTNLRIGGDELFRQDFYVLDDVNPDGTPVLGPLLGQDYFATGILRPSGSVANQDLDPMYQDELILGWHQALTPTMTVGISGTMRNLRSTLEDVAVDVALNAYAAERGYDTLYGFEAGGFDYYVITNPGRDVRFQVDFSDDPYTPGDDDPVSTYEEVLLDAAALGFPRARRHYHAVDLFFEYNRPGRFHGRLGYTWSQSYGNIEGYVKSDNGQADPGITSSFDQPGLLDGAAGYLPNDRRHQFKAHGIWTLSDQFELGANFVARSGRAINAFGNHPTDPLAGGYGSASFYVDGTPSPRGSRGRTPWTTALDLALTYRPRAAEGRLSFGLDLFNVFNRQSASEVDEVAETDFAPGALRPQWRTPVDFQSPRSVRASVRYTF